MVCPASQFPECRLRSLNYSEGAIVNPRLPLQTPLLYPFLCYYTESTIMWIPSRILRIKVIDKSKIKKYISYLYISLKPRRLLKSLLVTTYNKLFRIIHKKTFPK